MDKTQKKLDENFEKFKADSGIKLDPIEEEAAREKFSFGRSTTKTQAVRIVDINMSFTSMVSFMIKWSFAAIPAMIIILIVWAMVGGILIKLVTF